MAASAGDLRDAGSVPGSGRSSGEWNGNPLQYSCLENPMNRGTWQAIVHRVTKSQKGLKQLSTAHGSCIFSFLWNLHTILKTFYSGHTNL